MFANGEILWAPEDHSLFQGTARVVAVSDAKGVVALVKLDLRKPCGPFLVGLAELQRELEQRKIFGNQQFPGSIADDEDDLSEDQKEELKQTEKYLKFIWDEKELMAAILDPTQRSRFFKDCALKGNVAERTARRHFYFFLWGGMTRLAQIGPINKKSSAQTIGQARRGSASIGPALAEIREQLEDGATRFFLPGKHTLEEAYVLTLKAHFHAELKLRRVSGTQLDLDAILKPVDQRPTLRQFRYVCEILQKERGKRIQRPGRARPTKEPDPQKGRSRNDVLGPGYRFQIDATRFQVQLVSRFTRSRLIGDATVYIIIDVWSGAIVGYAVSALPASWEVARSALLNCFTDKSEVFKELGLPYTSSDWPCHELPSRLTADRGEFVSNKAGLVPEIGIILEIAAAGCPEQKGKVESEFRALKHGNNFIDLPGKHPKNPGRGEDNGKSSAALTIHELEQRIVEIIIDLNNDPVPLSYIPREALDEGWKSVTHIGLYEWGLDNKPGHSRVLNPMAAFKALLTKERTTATSLGIYFNKNTFHSDRLLELGYKAVPLPITIYRSEFADRLWFLDETSGKLLPAENDNVQILREKETFAAVDAFLKEGDAARLQAKAENIHRKAEKAKRINSEANAAEEQAKAARKPLTKTQARGHVTVNRAVEQAAERVTRSAKEIERFGAAGSTEKPPDQPQISQVDSPSDAVSASTKPLAKKSLERWFPK